MTEGKPGIDYAAQLAGIERSIAETRKFAAEQNKLSVEAAKLAAEQNKLGAEQNKLTAEALELKRERSLAPFILVSSLLSGLFGALIAHFLH